MLQITITITITITIEIAIILAITNDIATAMDLHLMLDIVISST